MLHYLLIPIELKARCFALRCLLWDCSAKLKRGFQELIAAGFKKLLSLEAHSGDYEIVPSF